MNFRKIIFNYINIYDKKEIYNDINQTSSENSVDTSTKKNIKYKHLLKKKNKKYPIKLINNKNNSELNNLIEIKNNLDLNKDNNVYYYYQSINTELQQLINTENNKDKIDFYKIDFTKIFSKYIINRINKQLYREDFNDYYIYY